MGHKKPHHKSHHDDDDTSGECFHKCMKLNQWDADAMAVAIGEYNKLCEEHDSGNISIKEVLIRHSIPQPHSGRGNVHFS